jgi:hypothetical protein
MARTKTTARNSKTFKPDQKLYVKTLSVDEKAFFRYILKINEPLVEKWRYEMNAEAFKKVLNLNGSKLTDIVKNKLDTNAVLAYLKVEDEKENTAADDEILENMSRTTLRTLPDNLELKEPEEKENTSADELPEEDEISDARVREILKNMSRTTLPNLPDTLEEPEEKEMLKSMSSSPPPEEEDYDLGAAILAAMEEKEEEITFELDQKNVWVKGFLHKKAVYYPLDWKKAELVKVGRDSLTPKILSPITPDLQMLLPNKKDVDIFRIKFKKEDSEIVRKASALDENQVIDSLPELFFIAARSFFKLFQDQRKPLYEGMGVVFNTVLGDVKTFVVKKVKVQEEGTLWTLYGQEHMVTFKTLGKGNVQIPAELGTVVLFFPVPRAPFLETKHVRKVRALINSMRGMASPAQKKNMQMLYGRFEDIGWLIKASKEVNALKNVESYQELRVPIKELFNPNITQRVIVRFPNRKPTTIFVSERKMELAPGNKVQVNHLVKFAFIQHDKFPNRYKISVNGISLAKLEPAVGKYLIPSSTKKKMSRWFSIRFDDNLVPLKDLSFGNYIGIGKNNKPDTTIFPLVNFMKTGDQIFSADMLKDDLTLYKKINLNYQANQVTIASTGKDLFTSGKAYLYYPIKYTKKLQWPEGEMLAKFLDWWTQKSAETVLEAEAFCKENPLTAGCLVKRTLAVSLLLEQFNQLTNREKKKIKSKLVLEKEAREKKQKEENLERERKAEAKLERDEKLLLTARRQNVNAYSQVREKVINYVLRESASGRFPTVKAKSVLPQPLQDFDDLLISYPEEISDLTNPKIQLRSVGLLRAGLEKWSTVDAFDKLWLKYKAFFDSPAQDFDDLWADPHLVNETYQLYVSLNIDYLLHQYYPSLGIKFSNKELVMIQNNLLPFLQARWARKTWLGRRPIDPETGISEDDDLLEDETQQRRTTYREKKVYNNPELRVKFARSLRKYTKKKRRVQAFELSYLLPYLISDDYQVKKFSNILDVGSALNRPMLKGNRTENEFYNARIWEILAFEKYLDTSYDLETRALLGKYVKLWEDKEV